MSQTQTGNDETVTLQGAYLLEQRAGRSLTPEEAGDGTRPGGREGHGRGEGVT